MGSPGQNDFGAIKDNPQAYNQALLFNVSTVRVTKDPAFYVKTKGGEIRISKSSANCDLTEGNCNYSLEGAVYGVYTEGNEAQCSVNEESIIGCIVTDADGNGSIAEGIAAGRRYYVREISAPRGYLLDEKVYSVVPEGEGENGAFIESAELPVNDPIAITLFKESAREGADIPSLEGTEFTVCYYDLDPDTEYGTDELDGMTPKKKWVITVKKSVYEGETVYKTQLSEEYLAEGSDSLFLSEGGEAILPVGYFTIKESKASEGYTVNLAKYYSGGELIAENNETIVGRVDYDGNISPEGINAGMYSVVNEPLDPESPDTGTSAGEYILLVISLAVLIAYIDFERSSAGKKAEKQN